MDAMAWYFVSLTGVGMLGLVAFEEKGHRLVTLFYLTAVLVLGMAVALTAMHLGWI